MALTLALGPALAACLGFGGGDGEDAPPPTSPLMTGAASKKPTDALPGQARPTTWTDAALANQAAKVSKGPLDKSPTAFPAPTAADIPRLPGAGPAPGATPQPASATGLPTLPGAGQAIPMAPPPGTSAAAPAPAARAQIAAAPAPAPAARKIDPLPAGVNAAADGQPILDVFRKDKDKVGTIISRADDLYAERSAQLALEYTQDGGVRGWTNPETGTTGTIRPTRTFQQADGGYCREYGIAIRVRQKSDDVKAQAETGGRFACRQPSGRWKFLP